jgi:DNA-binding transcriptional MerR regulator/effector-binding domain-containing protein
VFTIGEFSKITGVTVKALRFYHEQGLLEPSSIDGESGYRYYDASKIETARLIKQLRELDFSLGEIRQIVEADSDEDIVGVVERKQNAIQDELGRLRRIAASLDQFIGEERKSRHIMQSAVFQVQEKTLDPMLIAGVRLRGRYCDCGQGFAKIGRHFGRHVCGPGLLLHYDTEYRELDADFEAAMPIRKGQSVDGVSVRELPGGRCVSLLHQGPYQELGPSYAQVLQYIKQQGQEILMPTREVYLKGPGMIFKGNPRKYLTEIQVLVEP